jgi:hypothetical protein
MTMPAPRTEGVSRSLRAAGLYAVLTVLMTWPMVTRLHVMDAGDSAFFAWEIGWELHALKTDLRQLPHANIFHPLPYTLGMDEPVFGTTLLILPLALFTDDAVWLFNVARLLTFALSALTAYWLARELDGGEAASLVAGAAFAFSTIVDPLAHLSTLGTQWLPLVFLFLYRFTRTGAQRDAFLAGLFYVLETMASGYHGLIAAVVLPCAALPLVWGRWRLVARALPAMLATALALAPLYWLHQAALEPHGFSRGRGEAVVHAASLQTFLATSAWNRLYGEATAPFRTEANDLFPGLVRPALILIGAWVAWRERRRPGRVAVSLAVMIVVSVVVALGPEVRWFDRSLGVGPFAWLREAVPIFQMIRVTSRVGPFLRLALALLLARVLQRWMGRPVLVALCAVLVLGEAVMAPIPMPGWSQVIDTRRPPPAVYTWLAAQPGDFAVVELPIQGAKVAMEKSAYHESVYMVHSTRHWKRLLNGYSGFEPQRYRELKEKCLRFPDAESIAAIRALGARYVIVHRAGYGPFKAARLERDLPAFAADLRPVQELGADLVLELR